MATRVLSHGEPPISPHHALLERALVLNVANLEQQCAVSIAVLGGAVDLPDGRRVTVSYAMEGDRRRRTWITIKTPRP
jgi:hypothetical protein